MHAAFEVIYRHFLCSLSMFLKNVFFGLIAIEASIKLLIEVEEEHSIFRKQRGLQPERKQYN